MRDTYVWRFQAHPPDMQQLLSEADFVPNVILKVIPESVRT